MSFQSKKNDAISKIATVGGIDGTTDPVTFNVTTGEGTKFPASNFTISIGAEILLCTSRTGDALTCTRAQEGTTKASHTQGTDVEHRITAGSFVEFENIFAKTASTSGADDILVAEQATTPTNPGNGFRKIYPKNDGVWYILDKDGNEVAAISFPATGAEITTGTNTAKFITPKSLADAAIYKFGAAWTAFTPSWTGLTIGTGSEVNQGYYCKIGKTVLFRVYTKLGSSGFSVGNPPSLTLPVTINNTNTQLLAPIAQCAYSHSGVVWIGYMDGYGSLRTTTISTYPTLANVASTQPFTWAGGDFISMYGMYEAS